MLLPHVDSLSHSVEHLNVVLDTVRVLIPTPPSKPIPIELISLLIALIAVFFGPLIQTYVAQRQIRASVRSNNRQQWINTLRDSVAEFTSVLVTIMGAIKLKTMDNKERLLKLERVHYLLTKIKLLSNPTESDHKKLLELLENAYTNVTANTINAVTKTLDEAAEVSQKIFKEEWTRVKNLK